MRPRWGRRRKWLVCLKPSFTANWASAEFPFTTAPRSCRKTCVRSNRWPADDCRLGHHAADGATYPNALKLVISMPLLQHGFKLRRLPFAPESHARFLVMSPLL